MRNAISFCHGPPEREIHGNEISDSNYNSIGDGQFPSIQQGNPAWDQHSLSGDPGFANINPTTDTNHWIGDPAFRIPNPNFGVVSGIEFVTGSLCIDAGTDVGQVIPPVDGNSNGQAAYDMGAYEFIP